MYKAGKFLFTNLALFLLFGCGGSKETFFKYQVDMYTVDTSNHLFSTTCLISYGDYLFEFIRKANIKTVQHGENISKSSITSYDTTEVLLLSGLNKAYYEFDSFTSSPTIIASGKLEEKKLGIRLTKPDTDNSANAIFTPFQKERTNGPDVYYTEVSLKNNQYNDSIKQRLTLIKGKKFNSVYKINGIKFIDNKYCIVGISLYNIKSKQGILEKINELRPLNEKEKDICKKMLQKSRTHKIE